MAELKPIDVQRIAVDGLELELCRFGPEQGRRAVLLLHGASASRDTFLVPDGGLAAYLGERGFDVWTLDWRGSKRIVDQLTAGPSYRLFTLDRVGELDIPRALDAISERVGQKSVSIVAHCFGAGACSVCIAQNNTRAVRNVVLITLGLFYEVHWDGWIKGEDFILERILAHEPGCRSIDPRHPERWPRDMVEAYEAYPKAWLPPIRGTADGILHRLSFMFGQPYPKEMVAPDIHGPNLRELFGSMHMGLYLHASQMVRRGYAAPFDELDVIDRAGLFEQHLPLPRASYLVPEPFAEIRMTLISGAANALWHRDSIDLMYEWLLAEARPKSPERRPVKHVLSGYAHQDLLWGKNAARDVYPLIAHGVE